MIQRNSSFASSHEVWKYICELGISKVRTQVSNFYLIFKNLLTIGIKLQCIPIILDPDPFSGDFSEHSTESTLRKYYPTPVRPRHCLNCMYLSLGYRAAKWRPGSAFHYQNPKVCSNKFLTFLGTFQHMCYIYQSSHQLLFIGIFPLLRYNWY